MNRINRKRPYTLSREEREEHNDIANARADRMMEKSKSRCAIYAAARKRGLAHVEAKEEADLIVDGPPKPSAVVVQAAMISMENEENDAENDELHAAIAASLETSNTTHTEGNATRVEGNSKGEEEEEEVAEEDLCPLCLRPFPLAVLPSHSDRCHAKQAELQQMGFALNDVGHALQNAAINASMEVLTNMILG